MTPINIVGSRSGVVEHLLLIAVLVSIAGLFVYNNVLWRWDNLIYDAQLSLSTREVADDIIIIAIDDSSLNDIGRWPWSRSVHAKLIKQLEIESPKAIGLDIIFNEPDNNNPLSDVLLARAMRSSGKVVLPVFMAQATSGNSYPIEALPLAEFTSNAAALGHVHIDTSDDGIARQVYLREGIGEPHWLHYALALLSITDEPLPAIYAVYRTDQRSNYAAMKWSREQPFLIPYAGPPGHFQHIGYSQVLSGNYPKDLFRDKIVLVGSTAEGLGDALPTPLSRNGGIMPGVEIVANVIDALRNNIHITELTKPWLISITVLLVALPLLIYPYLKPASTLIALFCIVAGTLIFVVLLLKFVGIWVPVATILLFQVISYPLWSWRRLELAMRHINAELNKLSARQKALSVRRERNLADEVKFISQFIPIKGWMLQDDNGKKLLSEGAAPNFTMHQLKANGWSTDGYRYWAFITYNNHRCRLGLSIGVDAVISSDEMRLLNSLIATPLSVATSSNAYVEDVLQAKIKQVQAVGSEYEELRRIIDDSLSGMADGVLICSSRGQIMLSNRRAGWYLYNNDEAEINGKSLRTILKRLRQTDGESWKLLLQRVLFAQEHVLTQAQDEAGRDLMVQISPLRIIGDVFDGFIINLSDISRLKASEHKRNEILNFLSHDLRSPLASMIAMIELARNKTRIDDMRDMLQGMEKNTSKTLHLAEQFLQLSRANTNENIRFYDIDFNNVVLNAIDQLWALSDKSGITVQHHFASKELWTHAEPDLLERAIINLLSNAIKHSEVGGIVRVEVTQTQDEISCCVIDHGEGISMEDLPHLFEMFRRTHGAGIERKPGIGLGLALVDAVAKRHSGHVDVSSTPGEGSSFCLIFPKMALNEPIE